MARSVKRIYYGIIQRIKKLSYSFHKNNICVLMFHDVYENENDDKNLNISKANFLEFIATLKKADVKFVGVNDLTDCNNPKNCAVTFDDVYEGAILNAIPILREFQIPYTLFISSSLIDKKGYITSTQIENLKSDPLCTIGFHTKNHVLMRQLNNAELKNEIDCSEFEKKYDIKCQFFAYPFGSVYACSHRNIKELKSSEYLMAFGTINSSTKKSSIIKNPFYIPRINVCDISFTNVLNKLA